MHIIALDFDGVLCDSAGETAVTAWRAGQHLWPEWNRSIEPPPGWLQAFCRCRPLLETGYEAILLMRMIQMQISESEIRSQFPRLCQQLSTELNITADELIELFARSRDAWIAQAPQDWLARQRFYPGTLAQLRAAQTAADIGVYIVTTKQQRFVRQLLQNQGIAVSASQIYGLDSGKTKAQVLHELQTRHAPACLSFVEDRLPTLLKIMQQPHLAQVALYLATWGYLLPGDSAAAAATARIKLWDLTDFLVNYAAEPGSNSLTAD